MLSDGCTRWSGVERADVVRLGGQSLCEQRGGSASRPAGAQSCGDLLTRLTRMTDAQEVGLPSHLARFTDGVDAEPRSWWRRACRGVGNVSTGGPVSVTALDNQSQRPVCTIQLPAGVVAGGPRISMQLPSFRCAPAVFADRPRMRLTHLPYSGRTALQPSLLRYSLRLSARVKPCAPMRVSISGASSALTEHMLEAVLCGTPLLTLAFSEMVMDVERPALCELPKPRLLPPGTKTAPA